MLVMQWEVRVIPTLLLYQTYSYSKVQPSRMVDCAWYWCYFLVFNMYASWQCMKQSLVVVWISTKYIKNCQDAADNIALYIDNYGNISKTAFKYQNLDNLALSILSFVLLTVMLIWVFEFIKCECNFWYHHYSSIRHMFYKFYDIQYWNGYHYFIEHNLQ